MACVHDIDLIPVLDGILFVGNHNNRAPRLSNTLKQPHNIGGCFRIQIPGRLISD
jgi:hypothetical protein